MLFSLLFMAASKINFLIWKYFLENFVMTLEFISLVIQRYQNEWSTTCGFLAVTVQSHCLLKLFEIFPKSKILNTLVVGSILIFNWLRTP